MRKYKYYLLGLLLLLIYSCSHSKYEQLSSINQLIEQDQLDSAEIKFDEVDFTEFNNKKDVAYYNLIRCKLDYRQYRPMDSDTLINFSINVFQETDNDSLLAESYFYKGAQLCDQDEVKEGFANLLKAERAADKTSNLNLRHKIIERIAEQYIYSGDYDLAKQYCEKNYGLSIKANNKEWLAYAHMFYMILYYTQGNKVKAKYSLEKCEPYIKYVKGKQRSYFYANIASFMLPDSIQKATKYIYHALENDKNSYGFFVKSRIHQLQKEYDKSIAYLDSAYIFSRNINDRATITSNFSKLCESIKDYERANKYNKQLILLKDSIYKQRQQNNIRGIMAQNEFEFREFLFRQKITYFIFITSILICICIGIYIFFKFRSNKIKAKVLENQLLINLYSDKIKDLKEVSTNKNDEVKMLQDKVEDLNHKQSKILYEGKALYESMINGATVVTWTKSDYLHFIEYYKLIDFPFVVQLDTDYDHLSPRYQLFEILYHMGKTDTDVERIMGISNSTIRATKTRIKSKKL